MITDMSPLPLRTAERLVLALEDLGVAADVNDGYRIALVSVWVDLVVRTDGTSYSWWSGRFSGRTGRKLYVHSPADDPATAARRVAKRYAELQDTHPLSALIRELLAGPVGIWAVKPI